jgi:hypothetical protein
VHARPDASSRDPLEITGATMTDPKKQLESFIRKVAPSDRRLIHAVRRALRKRLPAAGRGMLIIRSVSAKQRPRRKSQRAPRRRFNA